MSRSFCHWHLTSFRVHYRLRPVVTRRNYTGLAIRPIVRIIYRGPDTRAHQSVR